MRRDSIAIIGGGGAGTTAAWLLDQVHDIVLFEAEDRLGGHAYTHRMAQAGGEVHIDMGVEYFNERLSPNLFAMHGLFGIETFVAPLSFRASFPGENRYWSNIVVDGALRGALAEELDRFHLDMAQVLSAGDPALKKMSVGQYLERNGYSEDFACHALLPLMTTFSGCNAPSLDYNLMYVAVSFNMSLLSFFTPGYWRKAKGGIDGYIRRIAADLGDKVRLNTPVRKVRTRPDGKVEVVSDAGSEIFDYAVFATHADVTLSILDAPSERHRDILGRFEYVATRSVFHNDERVLAPGGAMGEYCEFVMPEWHVEGEGRQRYGQLTRVNNRLQAYAAAEAPLLVTFDPKQPIDAERIHAEKHWKLPKLRPGDFYQKTRLRTIQGEGNLWYCGTDTSLTGHEGATVSGMVIAVRLGAMYPFEGNTLASIQFNVIKDLMGVRKRSERVQAMIADAVFSVAKRLSMHKTQSHKFIKDIFV
jgi:uncharacterized protein